MSKKELKKCLSKVQSGKLFTRRELRQIGFTDDVITATQYLSYEGGDSGWDDNGMYSPKDGELFKISPAGLNFLEEYYYRDRPILISTIAIIFSAIALIKSFSTELTSLLRLIQSML